LESVYEEALCVELTLLINFDVAVFQRGIKRVINTP